MSAMFESFAAAYSASLASIFERGRVVAAVRDVSSVGSSFGHAERDTLELVAHSFSVADPASCLIECVERQPSVSFAVAQWLWVMAGSDELDRISFYNSHGRAFSDDGRSLSGAFGRRMRRSEGDQLARALELLRSDPTSRRAVVVIADGADGARPTRDFPCALAVQLLLRDGRLEAVTTMRSQSALMVLPYDAALFMAVQVWAAGALGVPAGPHHWFASSFHLYEDEFDLARRVLDDPPAPRSIPSRVVDPWVRLAALERYERELRGAVTAGVAVGDGPPAGVLEDPSELHGAFAAVLLAHARERECVQFGAAGRDG